MKRTTYRTTLATQDGESCERPIMTTLE